MKRLPTLALVVGAALTSASAFAGLTVEQALASFDQKVRDYNLISFGNATLSGGQDLEAGLAVKGNLTLNGSWSIGSHPGEFDENTDPTLYLSGGLTILSGSTVKLESGYASMQNIGSGWTWNSVGEKLTSGSSTFSTINSAHAKANLTPKGNAGPASWNWDTLKTQFMDLSTTLNAFSNNGTIGVNTSNQTLEFRAAAGAKGPIVVDLDMNLLNGNVYGGKTFSNVQFYVPAGSSFIVNVINIASGGDVIFGNGVNFNGDSYASRLLWNFVDTTPSTVTNIQVGNGGSFAGSVLATTYAISNYNAQLLNGQYVAGSFNLDCNELHYAGFTPPEVPEPSTYGFFGAAAVLGMLVVRSRHNRQS